MGVPLADLATPAVMVWLRLRDDLRELLGRDLVAMWGYGARALPEPPRRLGDVDTFAVLSRAPGPRLTRRIREARDTISRGLRRDVDLTCVLARDASRAVLPRDAVRGRRIETWPLLRAHWLAGRYVLLHGRTPAEMVRRPTWTQIRVAFRLELAHLERHVAAGDETDPYEASYALLNGSRLLHGLATRNVTVSKREGARWALDHLPRRWHPAIRAAVRAYDGEESARDREILRRAMAPFVATVREQWAR